MRLRASCVAAAVYLYVVTASAASAQFNNLRAEGTLTSSTVLDCSFRPCIERVTPTNSAFTLEVKWGEASVLELPSHVPGPRPNGDFSFRASQVVPGLGSPAFGALATIRTTRIGDLMQFNVTPFNSPIVPFGFSVVLQPVSDDAGTYNIASGGIGLTTSFNSRSSVSGAITSGNLSLASAVPEPSIWLLMLTGFGLAGWGLRRNRSRSPRQISAVTV